MQYSTICWAQVCDYTALGCGITVSGNPVRHKLPSRHFAVGLTSPIQHAGGERNLLTSTWLVCAAACGACC
jgi:hypothetical protein